ncbi:branched-chain amino acid ABC transporter permease [Microbacterium sp. No. 7]|uniref:branched-chain amino acid ABC transporter permease n=1 Tax=Microbacterium sp. No. 7 TaxID=1714373 RepID=UPI0006ED0938|nr:branched-chain amino acid ABC transporter permease [Microbacterium sp. No. 7]ALJ21845.1 hypothetical protein AOA12_18860 [Microbacterium sp. No. 7]
MSTRPRFRSALVRWRITDSHGAGIVGRTLLAVLFVVAMLALSGALTERWVYTLTTLTMAALWASCLNIVVGYTGELNLSFGAFLAVGAYIGALGTGRWEIPGALLVLIVLVVALTASFLLSLVVFRAKGLHFALITAGLSLVCYNVLTTWTDVTGGYAGISTGGPITSGALPRPLELGPIVLQSSRDYLMATAVFLAVVVWLVSALLRTREGAGWIAVREDDMLAASVGIKVKNRKRVAFVLCSTLAALSGVLYAHWVGYLTPGMFSFAHASFDPVAMVIIGGSGTVAGPIVGAVVVSGLPELFRGVQSFSVLIYGLILLLVLMTSSGGVMGIVRTASRRARAVFASRKEGVE